MHPGNQVIPVHLNTELLRPRPEDRNATMFEQPPRHRIDVVIATGMQDAVVNMRMREHARFGLPQIILLTKSIVPSLRHDCCTDSAVALHLYHSEHRGRSSDVFLISALGERKHI